MRPRSLTLVAVPDVPLVHPGDDIGQIIVDAIEHGAAEGIDIPLTATRTLMARTLMASLGDREALARDVLAFADRLAHRPLV